MPDNFVLFASLTARSFAAWLKIFVPGFLLSLAGLIGGVILFGRHNTAGLPAAGHAGGAGAVLGIFALLLQHFWATLLLLISIAGFAVYASLASKYGLQKIMYLAWENKLGDMLVEKLTNLLNRLWPAQPAVKTISDATVIKSELKAAVKQDHGIPKAGKRILNYWLRKVSFSDMDLNNSGRDFKSILIQKLKDFVSEKLEPSRTAFWIFAGLHILVFVLALTLGR